MTVKIGPLRDNENIAIVPMSNGVSARPIVGGEQKVFAKFNPKFEYGLGVEMLPGKEIEGIRFLHRSAKLFLPKGTPYELRKMLNVDKACWYYSPLISQPSNKISTKRWKRFVELGIFKRGPYYS